MVNLFSKNSTVDSRYGVRNLLSFIKIISNIIEFENKNGIIFKRKRLKNPLKIRTLCGQTIIHAKKSIFENTSMSVDWLNWVGV